MFTHNMFSAVALKQEYVDNKYFMLHYQFIKHAFGLMYATDTDNPVDLRLYLDKLPDTKENVEQFRTYLVNMTKSADYRGTGIHVERENIAEVNSHDHDILQCLDIILGSINFRLNGKHKEIPSGKRRRGKRTVAKERVYKHINARIQRIYPYFNIGISTGLGGDLSNRWAHAYRHWKFIPSGSVIVGTSKHKKNKRAPYRLHEYPEWNLGLRREQGSPLSNTAFRARKKNQGVEQIVHTRVWHFGHCT